MANYRQKSSTRKLQKDLEDIKPNSVSMLLLKHSIESSARNPPRCKPDNDWKLFLLVYGVYFLICFLLSD